MLNREGLDVVIHPLTLVKEIDHFWHVVLIKPEMAETRRGIMKNWSNYRSMVC
jgi:aromatic ring-cleaving dioxygenase